MTNIAQHDDHGLFGISLVIRLRREALEREYSISFRFPLGDSDTRQVSKILSEEKGGSDDDAGEAEQAVGGKELLSAHGESVCGRGGVDKDMVPGGLRFFANHNQGVFPLSDRRESD